MAAGVRLAAFVIMKARICYTAEEFVRVELKGQSYPLKMNFNAARKIQEACGSLAEISKLLKDSEKRIVIFQIMLEEAAKIAKYLGEKVTVPTIEELDLFLTPAEHVIMQNAVVKAVIKSIPGLDKETEADTEWTDEEKQAMAAMPKPEGEEEKN